MRCPSCNKFPSFDDSTEPEVNVEVESGLEKMDDNTTDNPDLAGAKVSGTIRIVLTSACCGEECKEANFDVDLDDIEVNRAEGCTCDLTALEVDEDTAEITQRSENFKEYTPTRGPNKGKLMRRLIPSRYARSFYGVSATFTVKCECGKTTTVVEFTDDIAASAMDELN